MPMNARSNGCEIWVFSYSDTKAQLIIVCDTQQQNNGEKYSISDNLNSDL